MLEQAVIDAEALKNAAVKNAEHTILEKYSNEIKEAVTSLLEQEEEDPFAEEDPMMGLGGEEGAEDREDVVNQLDMAATDGEKLCPCPEEEEEVVLDLDQLVAAAEAGEEEMDMGMPETEEELFEIVDDEVLAEAEEKNEVVVPGRGKRTMADLDDDAKTRETDFLKKDKEKKEKEKKEKVDEDLDLTEDQLSDIIEALVVDLPDVPHGENFHTHPTKAQDEQGLDVALAKEQDTAIAEEQEELRKAIKKLEEQVKSQKLRLNKQNKDYKNLKSIALKAGKKLEEVNFSNAKLIYTNRVLNSDSLNERQKDKLVEAISKVGSVEEAKIVFETLNENLSSKGRTAPKTLNEAMSKNSQFILKSNKEKQPANKNQIDRMRKLAGII
jgi:hypothetical protein